METGQEPPPQTKEPDAPTVIIVGAGLAGLTLAILLEKANIEYQVLEKAAEVKPLGSTIAMGPNVMPLFTQLGLYDDFVAISKPVRHITMHKESENMRPIGKVDIEEHIEKSGYATRVCSRPKLYDLFLSKVPSSKIHFGKRVLSIVHGGDNGALIRTADGNSYEADVLVGADGAYSAVRQSLYEQLKKDKSLPSSDQAKMETNHMTLVGLTKPMDPEKYPALKDATTFSRSDAVIGHGPYSWRYFSLPDHCIGWGFGTQITNEDFSKENDTFRASDWGPESAHMLCNEIRDYKIPIGGTLGDLIDNTPKENIAKVLLEEKLFETWYHGRTVLIGDACHKIMPYVGQGAVNAMEDAVILANELYEITSVTTKVISNAFKEYRRQRYPHAAEQFQKSKMFTMLMVGQTWYEDLLRKFVLGYASEFFQRRNYAKSLNYRPQATFLPLVPDRGTIPVLPQKPSKRYMAEQEALRANAMGAPGIGIEDRKEDERVSSSTSAPATLL
ncbi:hypothetical protein BGZ95_004930 [Linnemannia exigua]|uniref:FAD-binding domain-containing protein n=1 Tax=Linnemannia exigua TaxID=604196 RepID=A0AAD4DHH2_9FUNG|nr:hypothetical protein BGZ95_004930 [Linnemannia exigua]